MKSRFDISDEIATIIAKSDHPLADIYDEWLWADRQWEKAEGVRSTAYFHASEIPQCMRATILKTALPVPRSQGFMKSLRIFNNGKFLHHRIQGALKEAGILRSAEMEVVCEKYRIGGSIDGIVDVGFGDEILELKSINMFSFKKALPLEQHKMQATVYMHCSGIWRTRFFYECKNTQEIKEIPYEIEDEMHRKMLERSLILRKYVKNIKGMPLKDVAPLLPPAKCVLPSQPEAARCEMRKICFGYIGGFKL